MRNDGNQGTLTYDISIQQCVVPVINCTLSANSVAVGQGFSQVDTVRFDAQNSTGTGNITVRATHTPSGTHDDGAINVSVTGQTFFVYPDGNALSRPTNTTDSVTFGTSGLVTGQSYSREILCTGQVINCASSLPDPFTAPPPGTIYVRFTTTGSAGTGRIRLKIYNGVAADSGWYNVTVTAPPSYAVTVLPDTGSQSANGGVHRQRGGIHGAE